MTTTTRTVVATGETCVLVVGMHRSGTSATAGLMVQLGMHPPVPGDLVPAGETNERGHWESRSLLQVNVRLIRERGALPYVPPPLTLGWEDDPSLDIRRTEAKETFALAFPARPAVWKDPRLCLTLPFWRSVIAPPLAAIFVVRDPFEVAQSLGRRDNLPVLTGLALWDRYVRTATEGLRGMHTLVLPYARLLADPEQGTSELTEFLASVGIRFAGETRSAATFIEPALQHHSGPLRGYEGLADHSYAMLDILSGRAGLHSQWQPPVLPDEPAWVDDALQQRLLAENAQRELRRVRASTSFRLARSLARHWPRRLAPSRGANQRSAKGRAKRS